MPFDDFAWADAPPDQPLAPWVAPAAPMAGGGKPIALVPARLALWHGSPERGDTGVEAAEGWAAFALDEIPRLPDFSSARFPDLAGLDAAQRMQRVGQAQSQLLAGLYALGDRFGFSLRYRYERLPGQDGRIRIFLIGRCFGRTAREAQEGIARYREALDRVFPQDYPHAAWPQGDSEGAERILFPEGVRALTEILRPEQAVAPWHEPELCGFSFYYYPLPFAPAENDMLAFCRALTEDGTQPNSPGFVIVDVTLQPARPLTATERTEVTTWGALSERWGREQRLQLPGGLYTKPRTVEVAADPHGQEAKKAYADLLTRYGSPQNRLFLYAIRVLGNSGATTEAVASALSARALSAGSTHQRLTLDTAHPAFSRALKAVQLSYVTPAVCNEALWQHAEAPETLRRLHRLAEIKEVSPFFRLPIPGRDGCAGVPRDAGLPTAPAQAAAPAAHTALTLGRFVEGTRLLTESATLACKDLAKHALIVGTPGSGKTTLCFSLLTQLWQEHRLPFLVLEPAKTEYRALLELPGLRDDLLIFTVGNERTAPFRFNPLQIPDGVAVAEHISTLGTCFAGAFSLHDPLPMLLDEALRETYFDRGWSEYGTGGEDPALEFPTLSDLLAKAVQVAARSSYKGELAGNIRAALETRLGSLTRGPKGRCFNTRRSVPLDVLMSRPVILELEGLSDDEKALTMMFLLAAVRAHARSTRRSGAPLSHVCLVEEAHTVIGRDGGQGPGDRANPQAVSLRFFVRMLAEMRALGEGLVIADQLPTAIAPEALKLTNLKLMHRVVSLEDRQELGQAMVLDGGQIEQAATLPPGHSLVFQEGWMRSRLVREPDFKTQHGVDVPPEDAVVRAHMLPVQQSEALREAYLPHADCGQVCEVCSPLVREQMERWAAAKLRVILTPPLKLASLSPELAALTEYVDGLDRPAEDAVGWHCAHVHFQAQVLPRLPHKDGLAGKEHG